MLIPTPALLTTAGVGVTAGGATADATGMTPALPPKAPAGAGFKILAGTAVAPPVLPRSSVLASELARTGRGARDVTAVAVAVAAAEVETAEETSVMGAPTTGREVESASPGSVWREVAVAVAEEAVSDTPGGVWRGEVADETASETPGGVWRVGSGAREVSEAVEESPEGWASAGSVAPVDSAGGGAREEETDDCETTADDAVVS
jgi:hypothetical protein